MSQCAYAYPPSRANWKKSMQVFQTADVPPNQGRIILAMRISDRRFGAGCVVLAGSEDWDGESFIAWDSLSFLKERRIDPLRGPRWQ